MRCEILHFPFLRPTSWIYKDNLHNSNLNFDSDFLIFFRIVRKTYKDDIDFERIEQTDEAAAFSFSRQFAKGEQLHIIRGSPGISHTVEFSFSLLKSC